MAANSLHTLAVLLVPMLHVGVLFASSSSAILGVFSVSCRSSYYCRPAARHWPVPSAIVKNEELDDSVLEPYEYNGGAKIIVFSESDIESAC